MRIIYDHKRQIIPAFIIAFYGAVCNWDIAKPEVLWYHGRQRRRLQETAPRLFKESFRKGDRTVSDSIGVLEYKCPCCSAALVFRQESQQLSCGACGNTFEIDAVKAFNEPAKAQPEAFTWEGQQSGSLSQDELEAMRAFTCPSCGGEIITDENTAATFCPYCGNPAVISGRVGGGLRPDGVLPFKLGKEDAENVFRKLCKGKPLLPKGYAGAQRLEKIRGVYVPFWLYDCSGDFSGRYSATRVRHWSDSSYNYTRTDHFLLTRAARADFSGIPMDASRKLDDAIMESIEPFDYDQLVDFETAYLSGYLADKYDVEAAEGQGRVRQRVDSTLDELMAPTFLGYSSVLPTHKHLDVTHSKAKYVLLPVWLLTSRYRDKIYTFAMNGQTGKITGTLPICPKRSFAWFAGVAAAVTAVCALIGQFL